MARDLKVFILSVCQFTILATCLAQSYIGDRCRDSSGLDGICRIISECPAVQEDLKKGKRPVTCGYQNSSPIVCCASQRGNIATRKPGETADKWCTEYSKVCPPLFVGVAGGEPALPSEFPHMAAIGYGNQRSISWSCGGTLIAEKFVLTAAHCLHSGQNGPARWVLLGAELLINSTSSEDNKGQIHPVLRRVRHPEYKPPSKYHDVAILEIGGAVTRNPLPTTHKTLHPACLPTRERVYENTQGIVTGWGRTGHGEDGSPVLLKARLNIFDLPTCNKAYDVEIRTTKLLLKGIDSTMLCAGIREGGTDTCQGDSGGPLQFSTMNSCMYEIWGITSFGKICAYADTPAIYMRVSAYVPWIESVVWPETR